MGTRFSAPVHTGPEAHPVSCKMGTGSFPEVKSGRGVMLTTRPLLVPRSRKSRAIPLLPLWAVRRVQSLSARTRVNFTHPTHRIYIYICVYIYIYIYEPHSAVLWVLSTSHQSVRTSNTTASILSVKLPYLYITNYGVSSSLLTEQSKILIRGAVTKFPELWY